MHAPPAVEAGRHTSGKAAILLLLGAALLVFSFTLRAPFHLDDVTLFSEPAVTSRGGWWYVWRPLQTRPLTYFTFWLNFQIGGQNPAGYHAVNLSLHLVAIWLLYRLMLRVAGPKAALIAAALFALHPIQTEPVAYVFERATLLAAVFCLLSAHSWLDGHYPRAIGLFVFALLSKEECVAFPLLLLLLRQAWLPAGCMLLLSLAAGARVLLALELLHVSGAGSRAGLTPLAYLSTQGPVIWRYLRLLVLPYGFTCDPGISIATDWQAWLAWAALFALAVLAWKLHPYGRWFAAGLILLLPSSSIFPAEDLAADRRVYLPMIAFAGFAGLSLERVRRQAVLIPLAAGLAAISVHRTYVWQSEERLWAEAARRAPNKVRPRIFLSREMAVEPALRMLDAAQAAAADDPRPAVEKGLRLMAVKRPELAIPEFERALARDPDDSTALNNYGAALSMIGRREEALEQFRRALKLNPCSPAPRRNLALLGITALPACE